MIFKSNASHGQAPKDGSIFTLTNNKLGISIHKLLGCGNELYLNCRALGLQDIELHTEVFDDAVMNAKNIIYTKMQTLTQECSNFDKDSEINIGF